MGGVYEAVSTEQGFWFSSHEKWKALMLPYLDIPIYRQVFRTGA